MNFGSYPSHCRQNYKDRAKSFNRYIALVSNMYLDWGKMIGQDYRSKLPELQQLIVAKKIELETIINFMMVTPQQFKSMKK
jgi:hypothetical protein